MANINVNDLIDLNLAGTDLFNDPESFMKDLNEESEQVIGGATTIFGRAPIELCLDPTCLWTAHHCLRATFIDIEEYGIAADGVAGNLNNILDTGLS
jgi:hypothetical protein